MACNCPDPLDCCQPCPEPPAPVLPRCDIALADGVFTNTTVIVEDGCITSVATGRAPQYSPAVCCDDTCGPGNGGGSGTPGTPGRDGADGENATIDIGQVTTLPPGEAAYIENVGSDTNAVLNFYLPAGEPGPPGDNIHGISDSSAGIVFEDGVLRQLPGAWPPALAFVANGDPNGVELSFSQPDQYTGVVTVNLDISTYKTDERDWVNDRLEDELEPILARLTAAEAAIQTLKSKVATLETKVAALESRP